MDNGAKLYRRYTEGDETAFDELVRLYYERLTFFIERYVHNVDDARDIAVDCFAELVAHRRRYRPQPKFKTYLFAIGKHKAVDFIRRGKTRTAAQASADGDLAQSSPSPEEIVLTNHTMRAVNSAVADLPQDMRVAVHLVYFEGLACGDAARVMNKTRKQVYNLIYRAKAELRRTLDEEGEFLS